MNRRHFFGMTIAAVAAAGLPALVLPERSVFLPPPAGWLHTPLRMREVEQYLINTDSLAMRWDAAWLMAGEKKQFFYLDPGHSMRVSYPLMEADRTKVGRENALRYFEAVRRQNGFSNSQQIELALPRGVRGGYV